MDRSLHGCPGPGTRSLGIAEARLELQIPFPDLLQFSCWLDLLFLVVTPWFMRLVCSLQRFTDGYNSCAFFNQVWRRHQISVNIFEFLGPLDQCRIGRCHIILATERSELALAATAERLGIAGHLSSYSVPTPPVAAWA